jgi:hypothetical protein
LLSVKLDMVPALRVPPLAISREFGKSVERLLTGEEQFGLGEDLGQDPIINVATAHGFADFAPRHKSQLRWSGSPARDQSRIRQVTAVVAH